MASTESLNVSRLFSVQGWVCVVTGGGTGIGLMATQALAANGPFLLDGPPSTWHKFILIHRPIGAKVYITGRRP